MGKKKEIRVVVHVHGGAVWGVYTDSKDVQISLVDDDSLEVDGLTGMECEELLKKKTRGMTEVPLT